MLKLVDIKKDYIVGGTKIPALKGVSLDFDEKGFVSILGPSGCGKTTLLNIVGGLDKYTFGDLIINGNSTKNFRDYEWDVYRNECIGFVFQSYNLISHLSVLSNVEMALTISGVSAQERKEKAIEALNKVGLHDQINKKPNQLSGGQMQRVAIARALVNQPDIILADEPTGALDSTTSVQVMEILKEISKEKLVIMVTHNAELAEKFSDRIIRLKDGEVIFDSESDKQKKESKHVPFRKKKTSMSFFTALSLSVKNLLTKKARTFLISFAGSIGIIGIALVLSLYNGFDLYMTKMQADMLSSYPLTISSTALDTSSLTSLMESDNLEEFPDSEEIYISKIMDKMNNMYIENNITEEYLNNVIGNLNKDWYNDITYSYGMSLNIYKDVYVEDYDITTYQAVNTSGNALVSGFSEMLSNDEFLGTQYDLIYGEWATGMKEVDGKKVFDAVIVVDSYNRISDMVLMSLGLYQQGSDISTIKFSDIVGTTFKVIENDVLYGTAPAEGNKWVKKSINEEIYNMGVDLVITGIVRLNENSEAGALSSTIAYHKDLTDYMLESGANSKIVEWQKNNPTISALTGEMFSLSSGSTIEAQYNSMIRRFGGERFPSTIYIYAKDLESKDLIKNTLDDYNSSRTNDTDKVYYTDYLDLMFGVIKKIVESISYVLIAFTAISLVVSSIMIGIITYISVLERTKEIGILRSIGARKKDISAVFNAETLIIGFVSGILGVGVTYLLTIPINLLLSMLTGINGIANLNIVHAIILVIISMLLTLIAGLIPSRIAAKKDPVIALRTE